MTNWHAAALAVVVLVAGCGRNASSPSASPVPSPFPSDTATPKTSYIIKASHVGARPVDITTLVNGKPQYELRASSVVYATSLQRGTFKDNTLYFYKGRQARLKVTAPTATVDEASHDVLLSQGVVAQSSTGEILRADSMRYNAVTQLLTGAGHVVVEDSKGNQLTGNRAVADLDLQQVSLYGDISVKNPAH